MSVKVQNRGPENNNEISANISLNPPVFCVVHKSVLLREQFVCGLFTLSGSESDITIKSIRNI